MAACIVLQVNTKSITKGQVIRFSSENQWIISTLSSRGQHKPANFKCKTLFHLLVWEHEDIRVWGHGTNAKMIMVVITGGVLFHHWHEQIGTFSAFHRLACPLLDNTDLQYTTSFLHCHFSLMISHRNSSAYLFVWVGSWASSNPPHLKALNASTQVF